MLHLELARGVGGAALDNRAPASVGYSNNDRKAAPTSACAMSGLMFFRAGLGNSPRTILEDLGAIQRTDVVLPLTDDPGRKLRIRCAVRLTRAQAILLDRLGLRLPQRIRLPPSIPKM